MPYLLLGLAVVAFLLFAVPAFLKADPKALAGLLKKVGAGALVLVLAGLAVTGRFALAMPLLLFLYPLLKSGRLGGGWGGQKTSGQASRVRTAFLEMELEHDTGKVDGTVLAGDFEGARLSDLDLDELYRLYEACDRHDAQSANLLEAFLDHAHQGWRDGAKGRARGGSTRGRGGDTQSGAMSREEALEVLGLGGDAKAEDIRKAHRTLMKKYHPDQGGSTYLAAKINQAKETLLPGG